MSALLQVSLLITPGTTLNLLAFAAKGQESAHSSEHLVTIFLIEVTLMLLVGRLLGEVMQRIGQPAVMGQLLAGVLLGPSALGLIWPSAHQVIFPNLPEQKGMIDAISQLGVLMLLLLTGMETDLALVSKVRRTALFTSLSGVALPFACGFALGEFLPDSLLPDPARRLATSLFLATTLSISSVKIVAMVIMEVDFMRRNIGQIILASAILDDTIGWIIIAVIGGLASQGAVNLPSLSFMLLGTMLFLVLSFTVGRRGVAWVIRWTNDHLTIETPVITAILVLMLLMALLTSYIGVHTVLGAFVAGILIGQSPILTRHIEEQLRGLIVSLFAPVFFAVAGLSIDLTILKSAYLVKLALGLIVIASFGKLVGCYVGGRIGKLSSRESTALAIGMNARGSTEVIVASIGLAMGVLNRDIYTLIVVMAIVTTMVTPVLLRWALTRIPPTGEEEQRLEQEKAEAGDFLPQVERLLIVIDSSRDGKLASTLAGMFVGARQIMSTVLDLGRPENPPSANASKASGEAVKATAEAASVRLQSENGETQAVTVPTVLTNQPSTEDSTEAVLKEAEKGYDMMFLGVERALDGVGDSAAHLSMERLTRDFTGVLAIVVAKGTPPPEAFTTSLNILIPTSGADYSRRAAEVAIAIAKASRSRVTTMHVSPPLRGTDLLRQPQKRLATHRALVEDIQALGTREGVSVSPMIRFSRTPEAAILRQIKKGRHNLVVLGVKARLGEELFFGHGTEALLARAPCSLLLVNS